MIERYSEWHHEKFKEASRQILFENVSIPDTVYHYTDGNAVLNIIEKKVLWATNAKFMNDHAELFTGYEWITKSAAEYSQSQPIPDELRDTFHTLLNKTHKDQLFENSDVYILSFSGKKDLLSQWRGYADYGKGYSIGFNSAELEKILKTTVKKHGFVPAFETDGFVPAIYEYEKFKAIIFSIFDVAVKTVTSSNDSGLGEYKEEVLAGFYDAFFSTIFNAICLCKQSGFHEENEYRIVLRNNFSDNGRFNYVLFRNKDSTIVPYVSLSFEAELNPIKTVIRGPKQQVFPSDFSLKALAHKLNVEFTIENSTVTFR